MKVAYDLDGTLFSLKKAIQVFNKEFNKHVKVKDFTNYAFKEVYGIDGETERKVWLKYNAEIIAESKPLEALTNHAKKMHALGNEILIITARPEEFYKLNKDTLDRYNIPYDKIYMNQLEKYPILKEERVDRFFDDRGELIESLMKTDVADFCELTLIDAPYNQNFDCNSRFYLHAKHGL